MQYSISLDVTEFTENPQIFRWLWAAVLQRAVDDVLARRAIRTDAGTYSRHQTSAYRWIFVVNNDEINSFENVCEILDLDPLRVRKKITEMLAKSGQRYD